MLRFQNFPVYQELLQFTKELYKLASSLPDQEQFEIASQLKRATTSALLTIAEGSMKESDAEFNRFNLIAVDSINEIVAALNICLDNNYINTSLHAQYMLKYENII